MNKITVTNLGSIDYQAAWDLQEVLLQQAVAAKRQLTIGVEGAVAPAHHLLFCEHPLVYTLGKSGHESNLLISDAQLAEGHIQYVKTNRGGDITFHGPGQLVGYPILDLEQFFTDIGKYLRFLEEATIRTLADYGIRGDRSPGETGVWLDAGTPRARKICAMGVRCSRWVTMHGFALNVNTDMRYFGNIVPCGITDKAVTSMEQELGRKVPVEEVREKLVGYFGEVFGAEMVEGSRLLYQYK